MKMNVKLRNTKEQGITLVALVVTIVVLLILAGITISYVMGDNGVFKKASDAKLKTDIVQWQERLELAKNPIFIEGLGNFDPDKYFDYIQQQEIINNKDTDVVNYEDGTYDVTTKPGYVFEIELMPTKEKPNDAKIEYIGQAGKLPPRIKSIKVAGKTGTSIDIQVDVARLEDGKLCYYYKEVDEPEIAYKEVKMDTTDLTATIGNLAEGKIYEIKVVAKNKKGENTLVIKEALQQLVKEITLDKSTAIVKPNNTLQLNATVLPENAENKILEWSSSNEEIAIVDENGLVTAKTNGTTIITAKSTDGSEAQAACDITVKIPVESITLDKEKVTIKPDTTITLVATVMPTDATNTEMAWKSSNTNIAEVSQAGVVTGKNEGTATITVTSVDDPTKLKSCIVSVSLESDWEEIAKIAKEIAEDSSINNRTTSATKRGTTIKVGQEFYVKHDGILRKVRVLGFNHDTLANPTEAYGDKTTATAAGISFEFVEFMIDSGREMNSIKTNSGGWKSTAMRTFLEGTGGIGKISEACRSNIKQVKKQYIKVYNDANSNQNYSEDKLWLLSGSEIWSSGPGGSSSGAYGYAIAKEGEQYRYYRGRVSGTGQNECLAKTITSGGPETWWLRTPSADSTVNQPEFCCVWYDGSASYNTPTAKYRMAPGFSI